MMEIKSIRKAAGGRPRALTREQVVTAAVGLGLEDFTMKRVAEVLGVSIATLYQYVSDREELLRLAVAQQMASLPFPADTGQHWSLFLRQYTAATTEMLVADPHILVRLMLSGSGMEEELSVVESFLEFMVRREFSPDEALKVMQQASGIAFAVAVARHRDRRRADRSGSLGKTLREALSHYPEAALPLARSVEAAYAEETPTSMSDLLDMLIRQLAAGRGEELPAPGATDVPAKINRGTKTRKRKTGDGSPA